MKTDSAKQTMEKVKTLLPEIILKVLKIVAQDSNIKIPTITENTPLYGNKGYLDSLALVALVAHIEDKLSELGYNVTIVSKKAFSVKVSPFTNVKILKSYIINLIEEEKKND